MPIAVKDYTWEETESTVYITVPLKGVKSNKVDLFSTEEYLKVSFPPFLFECFLYAEVQDESSTAQIGNGAVVFKLEKVESCLWNQLQTLDIGNKEKLKERREQAVKRVQERSEQQVKEKAAKKREADRYALKQQMALENEERERIENVKEAERQQATAELEAWKTQQKEEALKEKQLQKNLVKDQSNEKAKELQGTGDSNPSVTGKKLGKPSNIFIEEAKDAPLRQTGKISVSFTPRVFPTAARESAAPQEEEWLKKQAESRHILELQDKDLSEEERNPVWLRDKGNSFFKQENYHAAVSAYSHAIRLDAKMPSLYSNRAACHLKLRNFFKCIEDSSKALELLTPPVPQNAASRCKAYVRRGTAFCELELYAEGLQEYEAAIKLDPQNEQLKADAQRIREVIQGPTPSV